MQSACYLELTEWHNTLPRRLTYDGSFKDIFVTFLHLSYHCWVIHLYRPKAGTKASSLIASESAATTVRLFEGNLFLIAFFSHELYTDKFREKIYYSMEKY